MEPELMSDYEINEAPHGMVDFVTAEEIQTEIQTDQAFFGSSDEGESDDTYYKTVMYISRARPSFQISAHIKDFRRKNKANGVSGFMVSTETRLVFQFIQGDQKPISQLWRNIENDPNHKILKSNVTVAWKVMEVWDTMNVMDGHFEETDALEDVYHLFEEKFLLKQCNSGIRF